MKLRTLMVATAGTAVAAGTLGPAALAAETTASTPTSATTSAVATTTPKATATTTPATTSDKETAPTVTVTQMETVTVNPKATETTTSVTATSTAPSSTAPKWLQPRENEQEILEAITKISIVVTTLAAGISSLIVFINSIPGGREALRKFFNQYELRSNQTSPLHRFGVAGFCVRTMRLHSRPDVHRADTLCRCIVSTSQPTGPGATNYAAA